MANRNEYDIMIDMSKNLGQQSIALQVMKDVNVVNHPLYIKYDSMLKWLQEQYAELETEYNNTINKQ